MSNKNKNKANKVVKHWRNIKGYNRDFLLTQNLQGKVYSVENFIKEGAKLGLKETTMKLKFRRWQRGNKAKRIKSGELSFNV